MGQITVRLTGESPLLIHNERLADTLDPAAKALKKIATRKNRTDADYEEMARVEWEGGIYFDEKLGPYVPSTWLDAVMKEGARKHKLGTVFEAAVHCFEDMVPIQYKGPRTLDGLYAAKGKCFRDRRGIGLRGSKTMRTRPRFPEWALEFPITFDENEVNADQILTALERAGRLIGIGDYRPRMGRFTVARIS